MVSGEPLTLEAGEYAVVHVNERALLRDAWTWLLGDLPDPDVERRVQRSLNDLPAYRKQVHLFRVLGASEVKREGLGWRFWWAIQSRPQPSLQRQNPDHQQLLSRGFGLR